MARIFACPAAARLAPGGMVFHVLNCGVGRMRLFLKDGDFEAFEPCVAETLQTRPMRILAHCLMSSLRRRVRGTADDRWWLSRWPLPLRTHLGAIGRLCFSISELSKTEGKKMIC